MNGPERLERFRKLGAAVQSWLIAFAVLVGGAWSVYTFGALGQVERTKIALFQQAQVNIDIAAQEELTCSDPAGFCIAATVTISNNGSRDVSLSYEKPPFSAQKVAFDENGNSRLLWPLRQKNLLSVERTLRTGEEVEYPFFVKVSEAGLYLLEFRVPLPENEMEIHREFAEDPSSVGQIYWIGTTYLSVAERR